MKRLKANSAAMNFDTPFLFVTAYSRGVRLSTLEALNGFLGIRAKAGNLGAVIRALLPDVPSTDDKSEGTRQGSEKIRDDRRVRLLLSVARRLKRERDQAIRDRDVQLDAMEVWLDTLWFNDEDQPPRAT
jgi:hypothetical protein